MLPENFGQHFFYSKGISSDFIRKHDVLLKSFFDNNYNIGHNIFQLCNISENFGFITSEVTLDMYCKKKIRVVSRAAEQLQA